MDTGKPVIFDPSSYYGHNEAEYVLVYSLGFVVVKYYTSLSIARIFGGFPPAFFTAYHKHIPPSEPVAEYDQRGALYELFHYLNHTVIFGVSTLFQHYFLSFLPFRFIFIPLHTLELKTSRSAYTIYHDSGTGLLNADSG